MKKFKLFNEIVKISVTDNWETAKNEWSLKMINFAKISHVCLCGHYPIKELCIIRNKHNGNEVTVGNCCVKKFMNLPTGTIFNCVKRIAEDNNKSINIETINFAYESEIIDKYEYDFYIRIYKRKTLTPKQEAFKIKINIKIIYSTFR